MSDTIALTLNLFLPLTFLLGLAVVVYFVIVRRS